MSRFFEEKKWENYIQYLHAWADDHSTNEYLGQSPACYDEWCDNEWENATEYLFDNVTALEESKDWQKSQTDMDNIRLSCECNGRTWVISLTWSYDEAMWKFVEQSRTGNDYVDLTIDWLLERDEFWANKKVRELLG